MQTLRILAFGAALASVAALPVWAGAQQEPLGQRMKDTAQGAAQGVKNGAEAAGSAVKEGAQKTGEFLGITPSEAARYEANERGEHQMSGEITGINRATGVIDVKTAAAPLALQFSPRAVRKLTKGEKITVDLGYAMTDTGSSQKAYDQPQERPGHTTAKQEQGEHWVKGTVASVDHTGGRVSMRSEKGAMLKLHFPPADIGSLNTGDHIAVEMAFEKGQHTRKGA